MGARSARSSHPAPDEPGPSATVSARRWCDHGARVDPTTIADITLPTNRAVGATSGLAFIGTTTLSSCRRTTSLLMCIESDGFVANFGARQQPPTSPHLSTGVTARKCEDENAAFDDIYPLSESTFG